MKQVAPATTTSEIFYHWAASRLKGYTHLVVDLGCGNGAGALILQKSGLKVLGVDRSPNAVEACDRAGILAYNYSFGAKSDPFQAPYAALAIEILDSDHAPVGIIRHLAENADSLIFTVPEKRFPETEWAWMTPAAQFHRLPAFKGTLLIEWRRDAAYPDRPVVVQSAPVRKLSSRWSSL